MYFVLKPWYKLAECFNFLSLYMGVCQCVTCMGLRVFPGLPQSNRESPRGWQASILWSACQHSEILPENRQLPGAHTHSSLPIHTSTCAHIACSSHQSCMYTDEKWKENQLKLSERGVGSTCVTRAASVRLGTDPISQWNSTGGMEQQSWQCWRRRHMISHVISACFDSVPKSSLWCQEYLAFSTFSSAAIDVQLRSGDCQKVTIRKSVLLFDLQAEGAKLWG